MSEAFHSNISAYPKDYQMLVNVSEISNNFPDNSSISHYQLFSVGMLLANTILQCLELPIAIQLLVLIPATSVLLTAALYFLIYDPLGIITFLLDVSLYFMFKLVVKSTCPAGSSTWLTFAP